MGVYTTTYEDVNMKENEDMDSKIVDKELMGLNLENIV